MWLPSVIASTPSLKNSSASLGVMPRPPAAFSPLATTKLTLELIPQSGQQLAQDAPAGPADDVADEEDGRHAGHTGSDGAAHGGGGCEPARRAWARRDRTPRRCVRPRPRRRPGSSPCWSRAGSRWSCCRSAIAGAYLFLHAAGHILLLFIIAGLIALLLNPFVALVQKLRIPRGAAVGIVMVSVLALLDRARLPARQPDLRPGLELPEATSRATSTTPTPSSPTCRPGWTARASTSRSSRRARPRCRRSASGSPAAPATS